MRVLLAIVTTETCSLKFAVSMMRMQTALQTAPNVHAVIELVPSLHDALKLAHAEKAVDVVVAIHSHLGFPAGFVLRGLVAPGPFVAGIYPLPRLDWDRVAAKAGVEGELECYKGNVYSVDASAARHAGNGYLGVKTAGLGAVVLQRAAIDALGGLPAMSDDQLCRAWGKDILADLDNQCSNFGPVEFTGCVGLRTVIR